MRMSPDAKLALRILLAGIFFLQIDTSGSTGTYCCYNKCRFVYHFKAIGGPYYHVVNGIAVSNIQVSCPNIYPTNHSYQVAGGIVSYTTNSNGVEACAVPPNCNYGGIPAGPGGVPPAVPAAQWATCANSWTNIGGGTVPSRGSCVGGSLQECLSACGYPCP